MNKGVIVMFEIIAPKYLMLEGKNAFPGVTYEHFLIDVINGSHFFTQKRPLTEQYILVEEQSNGENDVYSSTYQMDFKLLVDADVMKARSRNMPEVDYSQMSKGFIFTKTKEKVSEVPVNKILKDIQECEVEDLKRDSYKNDTIKSLIKNLKKSKNLFIYYPYEYNGVTNGMLNGLEENVTNIFKNILIYRDGLNLQKDTYLCFKIDKYFYILEWVDRHCIIRDRVDEILCANYRDAKLYSVY